MKHPTKEAFIGALRKATDRLERELEIPEDPDEIEGLEVEGVMPALAGWMLREAYAWGYHAGHLAGSGEKAQRHDQTHVAPKQLTQQNLFGEDDD